MSCGISCIVTDVGDSAWLVGDTGRIIPNKEERHLVFWQENGSVNFFLLNLLLHNMNDYMKMC